ncbi:MAG: hypothetical protein AB1792_11835, partial [Candidatus Zixiibacteriota bacterium]
DLCARPCEWLRIPVNITNLTEPVSGYQLSYTFSRPNLVSFDPIELFDVAGTATESWEYTSATTQGGTTIRVVGIADMPDPPGTPPPIPPNGVPQRLVYMVAHVPCVPDTMSGNTVRLDPNLLLCSFTDPQGMTLAPISVAGDSITVIATALGDLDGSGHLDVVDVVRAVNCAFRGDCPACAIKLVDTTCDQLINVQDIVKLIEAVFRGGAAPVCP